MKNYEILAVIWVISALFNLVKIMQSYSEESLQENWGVYPLAIVFGPAFTVIALVRIFIIHKWK